MLGNLQSMSEKIKNSLSFFYYYTNTIVKIIYKYKNYIKTNIIQYEILIKICILYKRINISNMRKYLGEEK